MQTYSIGEWIKGPAANCTLQGFIVDCNEAIGEYDVVIKSANAVKGEVPEKYGVGKIISIPGIVLEDFFVVLNHEQRNELIERARLLGDTKWESELTDQFHNPFTQGLVSKREGDHVRVYSTILNKDILLSKEDQRTLYSHFMKAVARGISERITAPNDIKDSESFDYVIASIILISHCEMGLNYVSDLLKINTISK